MHHLVSGISFIDSCRQPQPHLSPPDSSFLFVHITSPVSSSPLSPSIFHARLKTFLFHKSFPPQTTGPPDWYYWTVYQFFYSQLFSVCFSFFLLVSHLFLFLVTFSSNWHFLASTSHERFVRCARDSVSTTRRCVHRWHSIMTAVVKECHRTQGNAVPPPPLFSPRRSLTSNFQKTQETLRGTLRYASNRISACCALNFCTQFYRFYDSESTSKTWMWMLD